MIKMSVLNLALNILNSYIIDAPHTAGVYKMINQKGDLLYIGKAKNLYKRLTSYTKINNLNTRLQNMVSQIDKVEIIVTKNEEEALLLEADLIKNSQPRYNILLRDDKSYPYILIREDHEFSQITKYRGNKTIKGKYFGPFASVLDVKNTIATIQKLFLLRSCSDSYFASRTRPCLLYQAKRCSAPCVGKISPTNYKISVREVYDFLSGKAEKLQKELNHLMKQASDNMQYELAALYRDRLRSLMTITAKNSSFKMLEKHTDVIAIYQKLEECAVSVFFFRNGHNYGNKTYFLNNALLQNSSEILNDFIEQFYQNHTIPLEIITNQQLPDKKVLQNALTTLSNHKVRIIDKPQNKLIETIKFAEHNATLALNQKLRSYTKQHNLAVELQQLFHLPKIPKRIEVYDNSHITGQFAIGVMIVVKEQGFDKNAYRKFNIKNNTNGDDYHMLREVLTRRFVRLKLNFPEYKIEEWPDFLLIDGGLGHLKVVNEVLSELDLASSIKFACIAKGKDRNAGKEQFFTNYLPTFTLNRDNQLMKYLQIIRDEAHRFAITAHRLKRSKSLTKSSLDNIQTIGKSRKRELFNHFGSIQKIQEATVEELSQVRFIGKNIAKLIYDYLHNNK